MAEGYISLHRSLLDHWLWKDRPFTQGQAWVDMLMTVNHADQKVHIGGQIVLCKRGESLLSLDSWGKRWGWSKSKVDRFFSRLSIDRMIVKKSERHTTRLSIVNYESYQNPRNDKRNQRETCPKSNNNDNNDNNVKKKELHSEFVLLSVSEYNKLHEKLNSQLEDYITRLNDYIGQIGQKQAAKRYTSHYHTILNWYNRDLKQGKAVDVRHNFDGITREAGETEFDEVLFGNKGGKV